MKRVIQLACLTGACLFALGNRGCQHTDTVILPEGPTAAQLAAEKDKQIAGLVAQVKAEQEARELEQAQAALVAANLEGILFAAEHVPTGLPRTAIEEEAKLGKERSPPANPAELLKAKDRVIAILNGEVEKARAMYGEASTEAAQAKAQIAAKDEEIVRRDRELAAREQVIAKLGEEAKIEREKHANDVKNALAAKDEAIKKVREEYASKERRWWINATRIAGLGLIVVGVVLLAVFKLPMEGGGLAAGGVIIGLLSMFFEWLTAQWWWPWLCGLLVLGVLIAIALTVYRLWKKRELHSRVTAALQDLKDEATTLGNDTWEKVSEHLKYRLGDKTSGWGKEQAKEVAALGLVNPEAEKAANKPPAS